MDAIIVPGTAEKIWRTRPALGHVPAREAYTKPCFLTWRAYAEQSGCPWFILSTNYGLIPPGQLIWDYNVPVSAALESAALRERLVRQGRELDLGQFATVVLLDWERFRPLVESAIGAAPVRCVVRPLCYGVGVSER